MFTADRPDHSESGTRTRTRMGEVYLGEVKEKLGVERRTVSCEWERTQSLKLGLHFKWSGSHKFWDARFILDIDESECESQARF
jgi:hypothetical protein